MEFKEVVKWLLDSGYLVMMSNKPVLTGKFERSLGIKQEEPQQSKELIVIKPTTSNPDRPMSQITDLKLLWNVFVHDCEIPHRVTAPDGGKYTVRQYSPTVARKLMKIVQDPRIDYNTLIESTKNYYKTVHYKKLLSNYIGQDMWLDEYNEWCKNKNRPQQHTADGGNRWESE